ncbi:DUF1178 family protein [Palleronia sp. KMU-117]|uniref:DUF1178 family protein n=1 Tax=Palleronia sp. KMU-117 TaxID=3434108 RepID=UPI003D732F1C
MIRYTLRCAEGHDFDSWFQSADSFDSLSRTNMLTCPDCGGTRIEKSLMAPQVRPARRRATMPDEETAARGPKAPPVAGPQAGPLATPADERERALAALRAHVEATSDYVGLNFAAEARAMHEGTAPARSIHGEARLDEAKKLIEDGVPVAPLPFLPRSRTN